MSKNDARTPMSRILKALAESSAPLNKYQIQKASGVGRQTLYNRLRPMKSLRWIKVVDTKKSRVGLPVELYRLTDWGLFKAATLNPELAPRIKSILGENYVRIDEKAKRGRTAEFKEWLRTAESVVERGVAPPTWFLRIEINADETGRVLPSFSAGFSRRRR